MNRLLFRGRAAGRPLRPGTYTLTVLPLAGINSIVVRVSERGGVLPLRSMRATELRCAASTAFAASPPSASLLGSPALTALGLSRGRASAGKPGAEAPQEVAAHATGATAAAAASSQPRVASSEPRLPQLLPQLSGRHGLLPAAVTLALLATVLSMLAFLISLVVRFLRGSWNP